MDKRLIRVKKKLMMYSLVLILGSVVSKCGVCENSVEERQEENIKVYKK